MSLGIVFKGPEGLVLAADSRVTLSTQSLDQQAIGQSTFDNANKLLQVRGQQFVGAVTHGSAVLGESSPRTIYSFMPEFEADLMADHLERLTVQDFAAKLSDFFLRQWNALMPPDPSPAQSIYFMVGGYDEGEIYGRVFEFSIPSSPTPIERLSDDQFGLRWGGQTEYAQRLINGFDDSIPSIVQEFISINDDQREELRNLLHGRLTASIPYQFLPLQDCVDLSILLIRTTIAIQSFTLAPRNVGGNIDVAIITRTEGIQAIQSKTIRGET